MGEGTGMGKGNSKGSGSECGQGQGEGKGEGESGGYGKGREPTFVPTRAGWVGCLAGWQRGRQGVHRESTKFLWMKGFLKFAIEEAMLFERGDAEL